MSSDIDLALLDSQYQATVCMHIDPYVSVPKEEPLSRLLSSSLSGKRNQGSPLYPLLFCLLLSFCFFSSLILELWTGDVTLFCFFFTLSFLLPPFPACFFSFFLSFHVSESLSPVALSLYWNIQYMTPHLCINYHLTTKTSNAHLSLVYGTPPQSPSLRGGLFTVF